MDNGLICAMRSSRRFHQDHGHIILLSRYSDMLGMVISMLLEDNWFLFSIFFQCCWAIIESSILLLFKNL